MRSLMIDPPNAFRMLKVFSARQMPLLQVLRSTPNGINEAILVDFIDLRTLSDFLSVPFGYCSMVSMSLICLLCSCQ